MGLVMTAPFLHATDRHQPAVLESKVISLSSGSAGMDELSDVAKRLGLDPRNIRDPKTSQAYLPLFGNEFCRRAQECGVQVVPTREFKDIQRGKR